MLANSPDTPTTIGTLNRDVHVTATFVHELIEFIISELPRWRDDSDRPQDIGENALTEYLCDHLNSAARLSDGWDVVQFRNEAIDEIHKDRKVDIAPKPCGATIYIDGRRQTQYYPLLPIECKRLPTPKGSKRDEREYVFNQYASTGGIQRFKAGHHGANHTLGAMIGYMQEETTAFWDARVAQWIRDLVTNGERGWSNDDLLVFENDSGIVATLKSSHSREGLQNIELSHLWVNMN